MEWRRVEWSDRVEWQSGMEQSGEGWNREEWSGIERHRAERSGIEWSGEEWHSMEKSGIERNEEA